MKAEELLAQVVAAADKINGDGLYAYDVTKLAFFGSYLSDQDELGDLDIAYELKARWTDDTADDVWQRSLDAFPLPRSASFMRRLGWPEEVAMTKLAVNKRVSFEALRTITDHGWPHRMLRGC